ncbi:arginase family protein [Promicromonospora sp. NPDC090134]|uniref:arginase family protein n=1 Tax=Promicromonospora sp. NPDC090134 TaxID=3364408 RepID=UPI00380D0E98
MPALTRTEHTAIRRVVVLDAPSNLGLRPPAPGVVPGTYKAPGALRDHRLLDRVGAEDAGCVTPPRYDRHDWRPGDGVAHAQQLAAYSRTLADRVTALLDAGSFPLVLGGDCSILLGTSLALRERGRFGLAFLDGHSDFRHPGNSPAVGAAAGEDLALVTGRGQPDLTDLDGLRPYLRDDDVAVLGIRDDDEHAAELARAELLVRPVASVRAAGAAAVARTALDRLERAELDGFWVHVDADVLDPAVMPAVDSPDPGGLHRPEVLELLTVLCASSRCVGLQLTVFDPDLDPDGTLAESLTDLLVDVLG